MEKMLTRLGQNADVVVRLLGTLGTDSKVPGLVFERLLFSFLLLKVSHSFLSADSIIKAYMLVGSQKLCSFALQV
jgi:hypothetical protein